MCTAASAGNYRLVISNATGSVISQDASLGVGAPQASCTGPGNTGWCRTYPQQHVPTECGAARRGLRLSQHGPDGRRGQRSRQCAAATIDGGLTWAPILAPFTGGNGVNQLNDCGVRRPKHRRHCRSGPSLIWRHPKNLAQHQCGCHLEQCVLWQWLALCSALRRRRCRTGGHERWAAAQRGLRARAGRNT